MQGFNRILGSATTLLFVLSFAGPTTLFAANPPPLGYSITYGILANTYTNTTLGTTVAGDIGYTTAPAIVAAGVHNNLGSEAPYAAAGADQGTALANLNSQPCTFTFAPGAIDLSTDTTHGTIATYGPGVYCSTGAMDVGGPISLNGAGTYIFRPSGALTSTTGSVISLSGASACNVFWTPGGATSLATNTTFVGTDIDVAGITVGSTVTWVGQALAFGGTISTDADTISVPNCTVVPKAPIVGQGGGYTTPTAAVVPPLIHITKIPDPLLLTAGPGLVTYNYTVTNVGLVPMSNITVIDNKCSAVTLLSGDSNLDSKLDVGEIWKYRCAMTLSETTTNTVTATGQASGLTATDIAESTVAVSAPLPPPLIDLIKIPDPLVLPSTGGVVKYTYTVTNPGVTPLSNVSVVDDKCIPVSGPSGDTNNNNLLDMNETWTYTCSSVLHETTANVGTATGSANGMSAQHSSIALVVVNAPALTIKTPTSTVPKLPNTGVNQNNNFLQICFGLVGLFALLAAFFKGKEILASRR